MKDEIFSFGEASTRMKVGEAIQYRFFSSAYDAEMTGFSNILV
jgi:hypothetical protein